MPELRRILNGLKDEGFKEGDYDVIRNNCNHFCDEFAFALVGKRIPPWVNRAATIGTWAGMGEVRRGSARACVLLFAEKKSQRARRRVCVCSARTKDGGRMVFVEDAGAGFGGWFPEPYHHACPCVA